jgi:glycosyltransferase involved in cell wall biosynthesis
MRSVVIRLHRDEYQDLVAYLVGRGFDSLILDTPGFRFMSKPRLLWLYARAAFRLLARSGLLREAETVVAFGHFAYAVKFLARLRLVRYRRLLCFGFFLHGRRWFPVFRWLARLDRRTDHYLVFSRADAELYKDRLRIDPERMHFIPLSELWGQGQEINGELQPIVGNYYFAGGWSNRDYPVLVGAFRTIPAHLVIICSPANSKELKNAGLPLHVTVLSDVAPQLFEAYVRGAKAGIIPLKHDTGSSGQSVTLALMRNAKCVIASHVGALREYVEDGVNGCLIRDMTQELPRIIARIEADPSWVLAMGRARREKYDREFSQARVSKVLDGILGLDTGASPVLPTDETAPAWAGASNGEIL